MELAQVASLAGWISITCASFTMPFSLYTIHKHKNMQQFKFVLTQVTLILVIQVAIFIQGLQWVLLPRNPEWGYVICSFVVQTMYIISMLILFWNLAYMYWVLLNQLRVLFAFAEQDSARQTEATVKLDRSQKYDTFVKLLIPVFVVIWDLIRMYITQQIYNHPDRKDGGLSSFMVGLYWAAAVCIVAMSVVILSMMIASLLEIRMLSKSFKQQNPLLIYLLLGTGSLSFVDFIVTSLYLQILNSMALDHTLTVDEWSYRNFMVAVYSVPFQFLVIVILLYSMHQFGCQEDPNDDDVIEQVEELTSSKLKLPNAKSSMVSLRYSTHTVPESLKLETEGSLNTIFSEPQPESYMDKVDAYDDTHHRIFNGMLSYLISSQRKLSHNKGSFIEPNSSL